MANSTGLRKIAVVLGVVVGFVFVTSLLMPSLRSARSLAVKRNLENGEEWYNRGESEKPALVQANYAGGTVAGMPSQPALPPPAHVKTFVSEIELTPRLSRGTQQRESLYESRFHGTLTAVSADAAAPASRITLPLPPELISLADLTITVNGDPSDAVSIQDNRLVWTGRLDAHTPATLEVTYAAMGKGIFTLTPPLGSILDEFAATITAHQSDIRMMELSLQPQKAETAADHTTYGWKYKRLIFGRPIVLDVLGIAPADRLGELVWLAPISVLVFGLLASLLALATRPEKLDVWMLLLLVGTFAGSYPLMYFAQDFLPLAGAILGAAAVVLLVIAARSITLLGWRLGLLGPVPLAAGVGALTLAAAIWPALQGVLLTLLAISTLVLAMVLLPRVRVVRAAIVPPLPK